MESTIIWSLLQCSLSDSERKPIKLEAEDLAEGIVECELSVYAKVMSLKEAFVSIQVVKIALSKARNCQELLVSRVYGPILHIFFSSFMEKKRVIDGGSWYFDGQLLIIKDWVRGEDPLNYQFDECTFWLHVRGLKAEFFTWDVASKLANSSPGCEEESSDPKKECMYDLWIKALMEKSWLLFKLNDEPADTFPRRLGEESSRQGATNPEDIDEADFQHQILKWNKTFKAINDHSYGHNDNNQLAIVPNNMAQREEGVDLLNMSNMGMDGGYTSKGLGGVEYGGNLPEIIIPRGSEDKERSETPSPLAPRLTYSGGAIVMKQTGARAEEGGKGKRKMGLVSAKKKRFHSYPKSGGSRGQAKKHSLSRYGLGASPKDKTAEASPISMSTLGWNCRGVGHLRAVRALHHLVKVNKPSLILLIETKLWKQEWDVIILKLKMPNIFLVDSRGRKGGLALLWPQSLNVTVVSDSSHHIEALIEDEDVSPWRFYGHHEVKYKRLSWKLLKFINNNSSLPTAFLLDFNEVLDVIEHSSYRRQRPM
ncbi:hypothetical protein LIER_32903 [Lithospermum erythrorhizon]|uniref:DUF4283 domain-containing protein n=1 Tax=Lithospermum erythrorhizon TaxID=34254 RepID=A0AAV3RYK8_LITER